MEREKIAKRAEELAHPFVLLDKKTRTYHLAIEMENLKSKGGMVIFL